MQTIRLTVVGSDRLMRDFVCQTLPTIDRRFTCVADLPCDEHALAGCARAAPDLVVFDLSGRSAPELIALRQLAEVQTWALLMIISGAPDPLLQELVSRRRCGFFSRGNSLEALAQAAFLVALGGSYFDAAMQSMIKPQPARSPALHLSQRERHVLQLVAEGHSTKEVANILQLSIKTVDKYRTAVMQKLNVHDVVKLTHCAIRMGFVQV